MKLKIHRFTAMGCPCELRFYGKKEKEIENAFRQCVARAKEFEHKYSRYLDDSVTTSINRSAGKSRTTIDQETFALLDYAQVCFELSNGFFDITSGTLRQCWNSQTTELPSQIQIENCRSRIGWEKVTYSETEIFLPVKGMELDFGGIVKEYAADALVASAQKNGVEFGLINLGGDIAMVGPQADGSPWNIGIVHPTIKGATIAKIELSSGALTTSGGYERFIEIDGQRYSHLLNPKTGFPTDSMLSATVIADQAVVAGSITSIALLNNEKEGLRWLEDSKLPYLAITKNLDCLGTLARTD
ncbi:MAG: thiamine biosynthesis protein ApbE [Gammaproteobacteria bacterium]|nr:thiamine biosynthesis protein ApbE [Gammaproteobacteria bacterium]|tara:strand:+ start:110 stop:1012 length:903 start_codon:yes stop_codon:yes gene_type:complete